MGSGEALSHQPGPRLRREKKARDRRIAEAARRPDWVVGFRDECWWTRPAQPGTRARAPAEPVRLVGLSRDPKGGGPEAVAGYGALRADTGGMTIRFRDGRPVSATTEDFLGRGCERLAAEGKRVFGLVRDAAAWHVGRRVRRWIGRHNRAVSRARTGCRIRARGLPLKAPWLNPIEPKWVPGKRAVAEPDRKLTADDLRQRVSDYYGCPRHAPLPKPQP